MKKILIPVTNHGTLGTTDQTNGTYSPELTHALQVFLAAGFEYDIASIEGGKAPMYGSNKDFAALSAKLYENGGVIAAVCHGPAALLPITLSNGESLLANKSVTGFTREEEIDFGTIDYVPFLLEESLARNAARYSKVQPWGEFVVADDRVITGQNPSSAHAVAEVLVNHLT